MTAIQLSSFFIHGKNDFYTLFEILPSVTTLMFTGDCLAKYSFPFALFVFYRIKKRKYFCLRQNLAVALFCFAR